MASSSSRQDVSAQYNPDVEEDFFNSLLNLSPYYEGLPELNIVPQPQNEVAPEHQEMPQENASHPPVEEQNPVARSGRISNRRIASREPLTREFMSSLYHLTEKEAAREAGWGLTNFRKQHKELGIEHWPYRKLKSVNFVVNKLQELNEQTNRYDKGMLNSSIPMMEHTRQELLRNPNLTLEPEVIRLRKVAHRSVYKRKRKDKEIGETSNNDTERNEEDVMP